MNKERLEQVIEILNKYDKNEFINYYELFNLDKNMNIDDLNSEIRKKRLQVLFHPDQISFIPETYHSKYYEMIDIVKESINTFSNRNAKEKYDRNLDEFISKKDFADEEKTEDLTEVILADAVIENSKKYGFESTMLALSDLIRSNHINGFTRQNGTREAIKGLDREKLLNVINSSSLEDTNLNIEQIVINYLTDLLYKIPEYKKQIGLIEQACLTTYYKYDLNNNQNQTKTALDNYCINGNVKYFTNDNKVREYLERLGDRENADFYVKCSLNHQRKEYPEFSYTSIYMKGADYRKAYIDMIHKNLTKGYNTDYNEKFTR